jgi:LacI family transcriptional regulator
MIGSTARKSRAITTKDIAQRLGISVSTVSRALHGILVSQETIERVQAVAEELGYRPNLGARIIATGKTGMYGLLVPTASNPYYGSIIEACQSAAIAAGYQLILGVYQEDISEFNRYLDLLIHTRHVDALIVFPMDSPGFFDSLGEAARHDIPIVLMGRSDLQSIHCVSIDYENGGYQIGQHLIKLGHRRIAMMMGLVGQPALSPGQLQEGRMVGLKRALSEAGLALEDRYLVACGNTMESAYESTRRLLMEEPRPTAIFAINDQLALGVMRAAEDLGLKVPRDLSVAGFDNTEISRLFHLTSGDSFNARLVETAVGILNRIVVQGERPREGMRAQIPSQIVVRGSTGLCPM